MEEFSFSVSSGGKRLTANPRGSLQVQEDHYEVEYNSNYDHRSVLSIAVGYAYTSRPSLVR